MKKDKKNIDKLFKYFDSFLIIDKSIDFLLIFVGLLAALGFENYIAEKNIKNEYVEVLARVHQEIEENIPVFQEIETSRDDADEFLNKLIANISSGDLKLIDGFNKIESDRPGDFYSTDFKSVDKKYFLNNNLYGETFGIYQDLYLVEDLLLQQKKLLQDLYTFYFNMYMLGKVDNSNLINFNTQYSLYQSINVLGEVSVLKVKTKKIIGLIENEILTLGSNVNSHKTYENFLSLSSSNFGAKNYLLVIEYAELGADILKDLMSDIDNKEDPEYIKYHTYYGQMHNNIVLAANMHKRLANDSLFKKDILYNLIEWEASGVFNKINLIYYINYYHEVKNEEMFLSYLNKFVDDVDEPNMLAGRINHWKEFADQDTVYNILAKFSKKYSREIWEREINDNDDPWPH